jgi:hypothetical protein
MNRYFESLMDVLMPPPNQWLQNLSHRQASLPVGVTIVRFTQGDDQFDDDENSGSWRVMKNRHDRTPQAVSVEQDQAASAAG